MTKIILYSHGGSGNHGCEAIVRGTYKLLNGNIDKLFSYRMKEDIEYGINELVDVINHTSNYSKYSLRRIKAALLIRFFHNEEYAEKLTYNALFKNVSKGDIALSIGGDNYCYDSFGEYELCNKILNKKGVRTVLWGCSVEPSKITVKMREDLKRYRLIVARESITYEALKKFHSNVILCPDPAFCLEKKCTQVSEKIKNNNYIGINVSPVVIDYSKNNEIVLKNFKRLIDYILKETDYNIALIPHVTWEKSNDYKPLNYLFNYYEGNNRMLLVEECNAQELKGIIGSCKLFIGARTHSTIAAYSSYVPTLVLGYSVKAKGIAKDIFGQYDNYVISTQNVEKENEILERFKWLRKNENKIRSHLQKFIPKYIDEQKNIYAEIEKLGGKDL